MTDPFDTVAPETMQCAWGRTPRHYQAIVIPHILRMMAGVIPPNPVLMVQSTGSGKSAVPLTLASVDGGVTIVIQNTLALGSDQCSKIKLLSASLPKPVKTFQLDTFKNKTELASLCSSILMHCIHNSTTSIIIFASPKALLQTVCMDFVEQLVSKKLLQLFCIDEIHLFIQFGLSFRKVFQNLRTSVIQKLKQSNSNDMKIPLLLMTATFNIEYLNLLEKILGIKMLPYNIFWGSYYSFQKRHIKIEMKYSSQHFKSVCDDVSSVCANTYDNKMIIISSTTKR